MLFTTSYIFCGLLVACRFFYDDRLHMQIVNAYHLLDEDMKKYVGVIGYLRITYISIILTWPISLVGRNK